MIPRRVRQAVVIAFLCHGVFILGAHYRMSYDAYTHMLFANHYAEDWFSLWEMRWYTGFTVVSYPPLAHQLVALLIPVLGFDKAFALILWLVATLYPLGVYAFSRIFAGKSAASYGALASAVLTPVYVVAHVFGQLPFLLSTLLALFSAASLNRYLREGGAHNLLLTVSLYATTMAAHHATLLIQPFLMFAVIWNYVLSIPRIFQWRQFVVRLLLVGSLAGFFSILVIWPFWEWGMTQEMQTPIDHLSRYNFFRDPFAFLIFFIPLYGPFLGVIPFVFWRWQRRYWGLILSFILLLLLGLGGTTPLPRLFFGKNWEWLTYDRFAFWASLILTPIFGVLFIRSRRRIATTSRLPFRRLIPTLTVLLFAATTLLVWVQPFWFPTQPAQIEMQPIVDFLNQDDHSQWRYITFGFGNQYTYLNLLTEATTIDGSYHTARTLPELRSSGVGEVDTAYWAKNGISLIKPILLKSGKHSVRWGFLNPNTRVAVQVRWGTIRRSPFIPLLTELGWKRRTSLENGVLVYENPNALPLENVRAPVFSPMTSFAWGVFPLLALVSASTLAALRVYPIPAEWIIRKIYSFTVSLIPLALCFWAYRMVGDFSHSRVYFTYDNALFFLSDAIILAAVVLWLTVKISKSASGNWKFSLPLLFKPIHLLIFTFLILVMLSSFWSRDWRTSLYLSLHLLLISLLILSLRDWHETWNVVMFGLCAALSFQLVVGFTGFGTQSTAFLNPWNMTWPGAIDPSFDGASVVQLENGLRILRAYGTMPHPNILGGFVLLTLLGPASLYFTYRKPSFPVLMLLSLGLVLALLTFSRSAWLALIASASVLILKSKYLGCRKLILLIAASLLTITLSLSFTRDYIFTRLMSQSVATEQISTLGRSWLTEQAVKMIHTHPLTGVGIGSFILELARTSVEGAPIEPVHNVFLLLFAELGVVGLIFVLGLSLVLLLQVIASKTPHSILASAILVGFGTISLFDHYLWTLAPGRIMVGVTVGLWAGQIAKDA
jgi:hypothetical protein